MQTLIILQSECISKMAAVMDVDAASGTNSGAGREHFGVRKRNAVASGPGIL